MDWSNVQYKDVNYILENPAIEKRIKVLVGMSKNWYEREEMPPIWEARNEFFAKLDVVKAAIKECDQAWDVLKYFLGDVEELENRDAFDTVPPMTYLKSALAEYKEKHSDIR